MVSVIIPIYKATEFVGITIKNESDRSVEVIVVDINNMGTQFRMQIERFIKKNAQIFFQHQYLKFIVGFFNNYKKIFLNNYYIVKKSKSRTNTTNYQSFTLKKEGE